MEEGVHGGGARGRSARRALRRRKEILDAAFQVFEAVGFEAASTRLIAEQADISEGTLYNYFGDKGELYVQALKEGSGLAILIEAMGRNDLPFDAVMREVEAWRVVHAPRQAALLELWAEIMSRPRLRERYRTLIWDPAAAAVEAALEVRVASGLPLTAPPALAARLMMSAMLGVLLMSLADGQLRDLLASAGETGAATLREILWRGLSADPVVAGEDTGTDP